MEFFTRSAQHEHAPSHHDWATVAKKCVLFDDLPAAEMKYVQQASKLIQAAKDEVIYEQDDAPNYMYLIHSGRYRASAQGTRYQQMEDFRSSAGRSFMPGSEVVSPDQSFQKRDDGHRKVRVLGPGDNFGACEMLALMGGRQTRVTCTEATACAVDLSCSDHVSPESGKRCTGEAYRRRVGAEVHLSPRCCVGDHR